MTAEALEPELHMLDRDPIMDCAWWWCTCTVMPGIACWDSLGDLTGQQGPWAVIQCAHSVG